MGIMSDDQSAKVLSVIVLVQRSPSSSPCLASPWLSAFRRRDGRCAEYPLSLRQVEDLLFERGIDVCHETVRF